MSDLKNAEFKWRTLTGLWAKTNDKGTFWSGKLADGTRVILVPNNKREGINEKTGEEFNDPDMRLMTPTEEGGK